MNVEVLAPGGSVDGMKAAIAAGADAVYMGGRMFGARAYADNPDETELLKAIDYCHLLEKKLYLTVNTLLKEAELEKYLYAYLKPLYEQGLDAVLVQDMGVLQFIHREFPELPLHASTQMSVQSPDGARFLAQLGAERIVPARELSLAEIREIHHQPGLENLEIECFVHGALCYCYSGQCLMSSLIGGRSGNRGRCAQPCRQPYRLYENGRELKNADGQYLLSLKDICTLDLIPELVDAGVCSFKIEGRMKQPAYAAGVSAMYRKYTDLYQEKGRKNYKVDPEDIRFLMDLFNRSGFSSGYYRSSNGKEMLAAGKEEHIGAEAAREKRIQKKVSSEKALAVSHSAPQVKINGKFRMEADTSVTLSVTDANHSWEITVDGTCPQNAVSRSTTKADAAKALRKTGGTVFEWEDLQIAMTEGLYYPLSGLNDLRRSALSAAENALLHSYRRAVKRPSEAPEVYAKASDFTADKTSAKQEASTTRKESGTISCFVHEIRQLQPVLESGIVQEIILDSLIWMDRQDAPGFAECVERIRETGRRVLLALPPVWRKKARTRWQECFDTTILLQTDGLLIRCMDELPLCLALKEQSGGRLMLTADHNLYAWNREAAGFWETRGIDRLTLPLELNGREQTQLALPHAEQVIYGRAPMMITAQCLMKNTQGCRHEDAVLTLQDRTKAEFPVHTHCGICSNIIYNSLPLDLTGLYGQDRLPKTEAVRLDLTVESRQETAELLKRMKKQLAENRDSIRSGIAAASSTRGHFKRGVE